MFVTYRLSPGSPPTTSTGWVVYQTTCKGECPLSSNMLRLSPSTGSSLLWNHSKKHRVNKEDRKTLVKRPMAANANLYMSIALAVTVACYPLSFIGNNVGMKFKKKALIDTGQNLCSNQDIDGTDFLPCATTLFNSIQNVCRLKCTELKDILKSYMVIGRAVTCDELRQNIEKKYFDFVVQFIREQRGQPLTLKSLIFLAPSDGGTGEIKELLLKQTFFNKTGLAFGLIMEPLIFVKDCAAVMHTFVVSSA